MKHLYVQARGSLSAAETSTRHNLLRFPVHGTRKPYVQAYCDYDVADLTDYELDYQAIEFLEWQPGRNWLPERNYLKKKRTGWVTEQLPGTVFWTERQVRNQWRRAEQARDERADLLSSIAAKNAQRVANGKKLEDALEKLVALVDPTIGHRHTLGVATDASPKDIKLAAMHHPDHGGDAQEFKRVQAAFEGLARS